MPSGPSLARGQWGRIGIAVVLAAAAALLIGVATNAASSRGASNAPKGSGVATVQRRDLVATDTESGTLSYADPQTIFNRLSGTITWLPGIGQVIKAGGTLYKVSGQPVILMDGPVPAYRDLSDGVTDGPDVKELKQNLVALGFDPSHQITINDTFDSATTTAVEAWQASLGETQTGVVSLGDVVFLPGSQRITQVNTVLGSTGGSSSGSGASSSTGASLHLGPAQAEFVSLTTAPTTTSTTATSTTPPPAATTAADATTSTTTTDTWTTSSATTSQNCPTASTISGASAAAAQRAASDCPLPNNPDQKSSSQELQLEALIALLKAETAELRQKNAASSGSSPSGRSGSGSGSGSGTASGAGLAGGASGASGGSGRSSGSTGASSASSFSGGTSGSSGSASGASSSGASSGGTAQSILQSTSTQVVVTVDLDATKQSEAVVGEPVSVELPDGTSVDGKITEVSPVAQTSSSSSSSSGGSGGGSGSSGGSSSPSATIPVTIALSGHRKIHGLDQAAVSVNFEQQKATNVLSVPVTALIATAGGNYAVQEAGAPHQLLPVTPGLFAAGYVQISGSQITPGLQVTDSQG